MRSLSFEQLILLVLLVGIPLLRAFSRWIRELRASAAPGTSAAEQASEAPGIQETRELQAARRRLQASRPKPATHAVVVTPPLPGRAVRAATRLPPTGRNPASLTLRQAFVWKAVLDPPPGLQPPPYGSGGEGGRGGWPA